jgi:hypothetical protein
MGKREGEQGVEVEDSREAPKGSSGTNVTVVATQHQATGAIFIVNHRDKGIEP